MCETHICNICICQTCHHIYLNCHTHTHTILGTALSHRLAAERIWPVQSVKHDKRAGEPKEPKPTGHDHMRTNSSTPMKTTSLSSSNMLCFCSASIATSPFLNRNIAKLPSCRFSLRARNSRYVARSPKPKRNHRQRGQI